MQLMCKDVSLHPTKRNNSSRQRHKLFLLPVYTKQQKNRKGIPSFYQKCRKLIAGSVKYFASKKCVWTWPPTLCGLRVENAQYRWSFMHLNSTIWNCETLGLILIQYFYSIYTVMRYRDARNRIFSCAASENVLKSAPFHPNLFTFGGFIPERVNTIKTGCKLFQNSAGPTN